MVSFRVTRRPDAQVLQVDGKRYYLATSTQIQQLRSANIVNEARAWTRDQESRQDGATPGQSFQIPITTWQDGYGFTFAQPGIGVYETADAFDMSAPGKASTWPQLTTGNPKTSTNNRGWFFYDDTFGMLWMFRGQYATKYRVSNDGPWPIIGQHYFGDAMYTIGPPAIFEGKIYVPLVDGSGVAEEFQVLAPTAGATTEIQTVTLGAATTGTYTLTYDDGFAARTTAAILTTATGADVQAALRLLAGLDQVTVVRTGTAGNYLYTITMTAVPNDIGVNSPAELTNTNSTNGSVTNATPTPGSSDAWDVGPATKEALGFTTWTKATVGPVLVRWNVNKVDSVAGDPLTAGNWGGEQPAGDATYNINALVVLGRFLYIVRPDGVFSFDEQGIVVNELPDISAVIDITNGIGTKVLHGWMLIPHALGLIRWRPGQGYRIVGAEASGALEGDHTQMWGRVASLAPYGRMCFGALNDNFDQTAGVISLSAPGGQQTPLTPHLHHQFTAPLEDSTIIISRTYPNGPDTGTASDDAAVGTIAWSNVGAVENDQGGFAQALAGTSHYLKVLNFNPKVPTGATIIGIKVTVRRFAQQADDGSDGAVADNIVRLVKGGTVVGNNKAGGAWPLIAGTATYGADNDLWGTSWTPADVNGSTFGVVLSATVTNGAARVGLIELTVYHTGVGGGNAPTYLAVLATDATGTVGTPTIYALPRSGLTVANDPQVDKKVSNGATVTFARYYDPARYIPKEWQSFQCYLEFDPPNQASGYITIPGARIQGRIDDGDWTTLVDADGRDLFFDNGPVEAFFPQATTAGNFAQVRVQVLALDDPLAPVASTAVALVIREPKLRGFLIPDLDEPIKAIVVLREGGQYQDGQVETRDIDAQRRHLTGLTRRSPEQEPVRVHDPVTLDDINVIVKKASDQEFLFTNESASRYIVTLEMSRVPMSPQW